VHRDLLNPTYAEWRRFLQATESWDLARIRDHELSELRRVVAHAATRTEGYAALYAEHGVSPDLRDLEDLRRLPTVSKADLRDDLERFTAAGVPAEYVTTGGSSGIPFGFWRNPDAFAKELAAKAHMYSRIGWKEGDPQIVFRDLVVESEDRMVMVEDMCELRCSSYHLTAELIESYRRRAWEYRPRWLKCYPSSGYLLAKQLQLSGAEFPPLDGVLCASENLYDYQRELLAEVFKTRVYSHYGHYELCAIAGFCETEDTYHVLPQYGYAELIRDGEPVVTPGESGEIVATSFLMTATPFVRYRTGDWATLAGNGCAACGRPHQVWSRIDGREQEFAVTASRRLVSMTAINMHDDVFDGIVQFRFHQKEVGRIAFNFVPRPTFSTEHLTLMKQRLSRKFHDDMEIEMVAVDSIEPSLRGKHTFIKQELPLGFGGEFR